MHLNTPLESTLHFAVAVFPGVVAPQVQTNPSGGSEGSVSLSAAQNSISSLVAQCYTYKLKILLSLLQDFLALEQRQQQQQLHFAS